MSGDHKEEIREKRRMENIRMAIRAREFSAEETLEMGFGLIDFALEFGEAMGNAKYDRRATDSE